MSTSEVRRTRCPLVSGALKCGQFPAQVLLHLFFHLRRSALNRPPHTKTDDDTTLEPAAAREIDKPGPAGLAWIAARPHTLPLSLSPVLAALTAADLIWESALQGPGGKRDLSEMRRTRLIDLLTRNKINVH